MGSPFASTVVETIALPFDPPHTATIHRLSGQDLDAAQYAHMTGIASGRGRNWAQAFIRRAAAGTATPADAEKVLGDPLSGYDRIALVTAGVSTWSYPAQCDKDGTPLASALADLDDEALEFLATAVLKLTKPGLFLATGDAVEAAQKNG